VPDSSEKKPSSDDTKAKASSASIDDANAAVLQIIRDLIVELAPNLVDPRLVWPELGGTDLVFDTIRRVAADRIPYGARLDTVLGAEEIVDFLRHVLKEASRGLRSGRSARLIRDQIQADLAQRFESAENAVLTIIERHLGLSVSGVVLTPSIWRWDRRV
jgi:hypothetical protein